MAPFKRVFLHSGPGKHICSICNEPVQLETTKADADGHAVHDECYLATVSKAPPKLVRMGGSLSFEKWKELLRNDCMAQDKLRAFDAFGEYVLRLLYEDGLEPIVEAIVRDGEAGIPIAQKSEYEKIVDDAVILMRSDYASLQKLFPERGSGGELRLLAFRGFNPHAAEFWKWVRADSKSTCGIALRDKRRVVAPDIAACDFMAGSDDQLIYLQTGIRACQTTPLMGRGGNVVGMISTHWSTPHRPSEKDCLLFDTLARQAAELIDPHS